MRHTQTCPKCGNNELLVVSRVDQVVDQYGRVEPWRIARVPESMEGFPLPGGEPVTAGVIEAYICRRCGYTELYTRDPDSIPVDGKVVREVAGPEKKGPYR
jgi:ribosomal protein S27AE